MTQQDASPYGRIYVIDCAVTGKQYVGQTISTLHYRWRQHVNSAKSPKRTQPISSAIRKYGPEVFTMRELEACEDLDALNEAELRWAKTLNTFAPNGYNLRAGNGRGSVSDETRAKMSAAMTPEKRAAIGAFFRGKTVDPEVVARISQARLKTMVLLSPEGIETVIEDGGKFAEVNGLQVSLLRSVHQGRRLSHNGWRLIPALPVSEVAVVSPDGRLHCPSCGRECLTETVNRAQRHVTACVQLTRCLQTALDRGNIKEAAYLRALEARTGKRIDLRDKRIPNPTRSSVTQFSVKSPDGQVFTEVTGMKAFALQYGLAVPDFSALLRGNKTHLRGWALIDATFDPPLEVSQQNREDALRARNAEAMG